MPYPYTFQAPNAENPQNTSSQFPYTYGMMQNLPGPMNPPPQNSMPQMYPNMAAPQIAPPPPFSNSNMQQARYAHGGHAKQQHHSLADILRAHGHDGDSEIAHINPEEAEFLKMGGGSGHINPQTGLPEYRGFRLSKILRAIVPVLGSVVGTALGGPAGGAIGGGIGGALSGKKPLKNIKGAALGGLGGYAFGSMAPGIGQSMGLSPGSFAGRAMGMNPMYGSAGSGFGGMFGSGSKAASALSGGRGGSPWSNLVGGGAGSGAGEGGGGGGGLLGGLLGGGGGGMLDTLLGGGAILGNLLAKPKAPKQQNLAEGLAAAGVPRQDNRPLGPIRPVEARQNPLDPNWDPTRAGEMGEQNFFNFYDPNVYHAAYAAGGHATKYHYADGGRYLDGDTHGQADEIDAKLSDGEYVIDASTVSDLGDGNNKAGAKMLKHFVENVRTHKRSNPRGLPPAAKPIAQYMKGGRK